MLLNIRQGTGRSPQQGPPGTDAAVEKPWGKPIPAAPSQLTDSWLTLGILNILISIFGGILFMSRMTNICFSGHQFSHIKNLNYY